MAAYQQARQVGDLTGPFVIPYREVPREQTDTGPITVTEMENAIEQRKEERAEKRKKAVTFWLATISTASVLIGGCAIGVYKVVLFMEKINNTVAAQGQEIRAASQNTPKVVYVKVPDQNMAYTPGPDDGQYRYVRPVPKKIEKKITKKAVKKGSD
jgi:hypothetical protein